MSGSGSLAEVSGLTIGPTAGGPPVLHDARLTIGRGQVLGVVGRSGSGKSSLAFGLLGHVRPGLERRRGTVRVAGLDPFGRTDARRLRGRVVSFLGQDPASSLNPALRIGKQVAEAVGLRSSAPRAGDVGAQVEDLLRSVGLPADRAFQRRLPHQLSGGQAQRVALAIALAGTPRLLVLDEPTSSLDTALAARMRRLLVDVLSDGDRSALLVSHDPVWVSSVADDVIRLDDGRIVEARTPPLPPVPATVRARPTDAPAAGGGLYVKELVAVHGREPVLHDVSLTVAGGSCTAVVGPSGSGKTTLARCLVGLHRPARGSVAWREDASGSDGRVAAQLVAQDARGALNPRESARTALMRPLTGLRRQPAEKAAAEAGRLLGLVGLPPEVLGRRPGELSGGQRQRVNLARALAADARLLVCDEITSALDPETGGGVLHLLNSLRRTLGLTVVLVTHDLAAAARCAEQVVVLDAGQVVESGPADRVLAHPEHAVTRELLACAAHLPPGTSVLPVLEQE
ncbi:ATP-binding cassette domain-containing protein [Streptomyces sp. NPDC096040]|uniref:ABC transporter ATP-binding protein n=1 Tax=Streptomyces sp. NPDC096040 TaxID=3155541 RepID=UPI0033217B4A